ncbi:acyclic terpene utilization AtuA family protein [Halalkalibacter oceani]|uniref:acyclic terpene utilization AtuA family protein n=1 Tax=Halalkalibacter oceani TaxID=1653776 RepID=UPI003396A751
MKEVRVVAATGMLGSGFSEESLQKALSQNPDVIGCDAGSTDPGPYYLGAGMPMSSREAVKRDLRLMIRGGLQKRIPVLVGSAGTAGGNPHLQWTLEIVREIAREDNLHFKVATIEAELSKETLLRYMQAGKMKELYPAPEFDESMVDELERVVGAMGPEPYIKAIEQGADVVLAGRSSDTSIYAAVPIMKGLDTGSTWHAAKVLECGAGCVEQRLYPDCMMAWIKEDSFKVEPPNPQMRCTPVSVLSHSLYENTNPYELVEPTGMLVTSQAAYEPDGERGVVVKGSRYHHADTYTIRIEGVKKAGYRQVAIGSVSDPVVLKQLPAFLEDVKGRIKQKVLVSTGVEETDYQLQFRVYGEPGSEREVGVVLEVLGETEEQAESIMAIVWHTVLHHPVKEWSGLVSQIAFPYSPPNINAGIVYQFCLNHIVEVDDPLELFPIHYEEL